MYKKKKFIGEKTLLYFNCYLNGMTIQEIADSAGVSYRAVTGLIERTRNKKCEYSPSCFTCPMRDCMMSREHAYLVNMTETDIKNYSKEYVAQRRKRLNGISGEK